MRKLFAAAAIIVLAGHAMAASLYERMGERDGLASLATRLLDIALQDDRIKAFWADSNVDRSKKELSDQFCQVTGGPCVYKGQEMKKVHAKLHIHDGDFNALVEDLQQAMEEQDIPFGTQNEFLALLAPMHRDVVKP